MLVQELFTALLIAPVADLGAVPVNKEDPNEDDKLCDITVGDVLGPLIKKGGIGDRDTNFSLLSYSFSLVSSHLERTEQSQRRKMYGLRHLHFPDPISITPQLLLRTEPGTAPRAQLRDGPDELRRWTPLR